MSDDELLDIYAEDGTHLGIKPRGAVHRDGDWHRCLHLWVVRADGVLLQRRSAAKDAWPSHLDATAAGHLIAGEDVAAGLREADEELGVHYAPQALHGLGAHRAVDHPAPGATNREVQLVFAVRDDRPLEAWTAFARDELDGLVLLDHDAFAAVAAPGPADERVPAQEWDGTRVRRHAVTRAELVPSPYLPLIAAPLRALGRAR